MSESIDIEKKRIQSALAELTHRNEQNVSESVTGFCEDELQHTEGTNKNITHEEIDDQDVTQHRIENRIVN